jgi:hypothetical protein
MPSIPATVKTRAQRRWSVLIGVPFHPSIADTSWLDERRPSRAFALPASIAQRTWEPTWSPADHPVACDADLVG